MSLIHDIEQDLRTGTPGPWGSKRIHQGEIWADGKCIACCWTTPPRDETWREDTLRIARVPQLEAALLAAEELAEAMRLTIQWLQLAGVDTEKPQAILTAYRKAVGEDEG